MADGVHRHFSSRWLRQNARSNAGSPHQAHSASRNTGPSGPRRMFFGLTSPCTSARLLAWVAATRASSARRQVGMRAAGRHQVGLQADVVEDPVGGEVRRDGGVRGGGGMDARERIGDPGGERRIGVAVAQLRLPQRIAVGRQELHGQRARWLRRGRAAAARHRARRRWRAASSAPRSGCARPAPASPPPRAAWPARASRRPDRREGRCARCPTTRRRSAVRRTCIGIGSQQAHAAEGVEDFGGRGFGHFLHAPERYTTRMPSAALMPAT